MSRLNRIRWVLSGTILAVLFSFSANALDFNGGWATDASNCSMVFVKKKNKILMTGAATLRVGDDLLTADRLAVGAVVDPLTRGRDPFARGNGSCLF